jgi:predicted transcriptional regulator
MKKEELLPGLNFIVEHKLSGKELEFFILFLDKPMSAENIASVTIMNKANVHHILKMLRLKNLIKIKEKSASGGFIYELID